MAHNNTYMTIYRTFAETEAAIRKLQEVGFELGHLSVIGRDDGTDKHMAACYNTGQGLKLHARSEGSLTKIRALLSGWGFFWSVESGPVHVVGPLVQTMVVLQEGSGGLEDMSALGAALSCIGIPKGSIVQYEKALMSNQLLLCARGAQDEIDRAHTVLIETGPVNGTLHHDAAD